MPYKNPVNKKIYMREYMRRRRANDKRRKAEALQGKEKSVT